VLSLNRNFGHSFTTPCYPNSAQWIIWSFKYTRTGNACDMYALLFGFLGELLPCRLLRRLLFRFGCLCLDLLFVFLLFLLPLLLLRLGQLALIRRRGNEGMVGGHRLDLRRFNLFGGVVTFENNAVDTIVCGPAH